MVVIINTCTLLSSELLILCIQVGKDINPLVYFASQKMDSTTKLRDEVTDSVHQDSLINLMRQVTYECKAMIIMSSIIICLGLMGLVIPDFTHYIVGLTVYGHCFWAAGLVSVTNNKLLLYLCIQRLPSLLYSI